jgi:hypothetical protein
MRTPTFLPRSLVRTIAGAAVALAAPLASAAAFQPALDGDTPVRVTLADVNASNEKVAMAYKGSRAIAVPSAPHAV